MPTPESINCREGVRAGENVAVPMEMIQVEWEAGGWLLGRKTIGVFMIGPCYLPHPCTFTIVNAALMSFIHRLLLILIFTPEMLFFFSSPSYCCFLFYLQLKYIAHKKAFSGPQVQVSTYPVLKDTIVA